MALKIFVSAGEPSGDLLAGELLEQLKILLPDAEFFGICGPRMRAAGCEELFGIEELSVMGFVEVLKHLSYIKRMEFSLLEEIDQRKPDIAILVDYPGFHLRLGDALKLRGAFVFQYVAPQLWAWHEKRTKILKSSTDEVLGIMPFEVDFFRQRDVNFTYVGTPQVDRAAKASGNRGRFGLNPSDKIVGFFPGSRKGEIQRLLPRMLAARDSLRKSDPSIRFAISAAPNLSLQLFAEQLGVELPPPAIATDDLKVFHIGDTTLVQGQSIHLMKCSDSAVVTSGTATLECALVGTPMAVAYVMQNLSYKIAKHFVKLPHISLVNLVADYGLVKEFVQNFSGDELAQELTRLISDETYRAQKKSELDRLNDKLKGNLAQKAAETIASCYREGLPRSRHLQGLNNRPLESATSK
ncbi:MAG: lipid-A-disaccharide synthase [Proteobacteria bacterium]|nr:MAG: lipid-A-disaccharide synthase [Pseudomonadota bacterium]